MNTSNPSDCDAFQRTIWPKDNFSVPLKQSSVIDIGTLFSKVPCIRKASKLSQSELAIRVGVHANLIGRYERGEAIPSVEIAAKIASELKVSLDYLIGLSKLIIDSELPTRVLEINTLSIEDKQQLHAVIDALLRDYKVKKAYSK